MYEGSLNAVPSLRAVPISQLNNQNMLRAVDR